VQVTAKGMPMRSRWTVLLAGTALTALLAGCAGTPSEPTRGTVDAPRTIEMTMTDQLRFDPDQITVKAGETVRFVVENPTTLEHDFTIGDEHAQAEHAAEMSHGHAMMHDDPNAILVPPGETGELVYTFGEPGELLIGCHVGGHYDAGMRATIVVEE
jgi:uncharacterized cupredoxin-like copper-binding protein